MPSTKANAVNDNGTVVVGDSSSSGGTRAFRWKEGRQTAMKDLGVLTGGHMSGASGVNSDGTVVVGVSASSEGIRAFRWKEGKEEEPSVMDNLGVLEGDNRSQAFGVNSDGTVVVGVSSFVGVSSERKYAFRWKEGKEEEPSVMDNLGVLEGDNRSQAFGVNSDGTVVVGVSSSSTRMRAFHWEEGQGMQALPTFPECTNSEAEAVSNDGTIIVGWCRTERRNRVAIVWENRHPFYLGDSPLTNVQSSMAYGITSLCSSIGSSIVGTCGDQAARWKNGIHILGKLYDDDNPIIARATCMNGTIIVGNSGSHAFRWKEGRITAMEDLGHL